MRRSLAGVLSAGGSTAPGVIQTPEAYANLFFFWDPTQDLSVSGGLLQSWTDQGPNGVVMAVPGASDPPTVTNDASGLTAVSLATSPQRIEVDDPDLDNLWSGGASLSFVYRIGTLVTPFGGPLVMAEKSLIGQAVGNQGWSLRVGSAAGAIPGLLQFNHVTEDELGDYVLTLDDVTFEDGDLVAGSITWDGDVTANGAFTIRIFDKVTDGFLTFDQNDVGAGVTRTIPTGTTIGDDSAGSMSLGNFREGLDSPFTGSILGVWASKPADTSLDAAYQQRFIAPETPGGTQSGGSGIATPRAAGGTLLNALGPLAFPGANEFRIGTKAHQSATAFNTATYNTNIINNSNLFGTGDECKPVAWTATVGSADVDLVAGAPGNFRSLDNYRENVLGIPRTSYVWHFVGVWFNSMPAFFANGSEINPGNFQSRIQLLCQSLFNELTTEGLIDALSSRIDVCNELHQFDDEASLSFRGITNQGGFPIRTRSGDPDVAALTFQAARAVFGPGRELAIVNFAMENGPPYGTATALNQAGGAFTARATRRNMAMLASVIDMISRGIQVDIYGYQMHLRQGDYQDYQLTQAVAAELGARGVRTEICEWDLGIANQSGGGAGNLNREQSDDTASRISKCVVNANHLCKRWTFWQNAGAFAVGLAHDYLVDYATGNLGPFYTNLRDQCVRNILPAQDRNRRGVVGRRFVTEAPTSETDFPGCGFIRTGSFARVFAVNGPLSSDGQFNERTGLTLLSGRTLRMPWTYFDVNSVQTRRIAAQIISKSAYTIKLEIKRIGSGNGNPILSIEGTGSPLVVTVEGAQLRVAGSLHPVTIADNAEIRLVMSIGNGQVVAAIGGTVLTVATTLVVPDDIYFGGNSSGTVSNWRLGYFCLYDGTREENLLTQTASQNWGEEDTLAMLDPSAPGVNVQGVFGSDAGLVVVTPPAG